MEALDAQRAFGQHQLRAERRQHLAPFQRHRLRHGQRDGVALGRGHESQRDARVPAGGLDQFLPRVSTPRASASHTMDAPMRHFTE